MQVPRFMPLLGAVLALLATSASADEVLDWNHTMVRTFRATGMPPPIGARIAAITHGAMFDAYNGIERRYEPFHVTEEAPPGASRRAAIIQAAYTALVTLMPSQRARFDAQLADSLAKLTDDGGGRSHALGREWGQQVARHILAWRSTDGFTASLPPFTGGTAIGQWRPTPPWFDPMVLEQFSYMTPFVLLSPSQFRIPPPPPLTSAEYAASLNEVKALGRRTGSSRTPEQTEVAFFWAGSGTNHWNEIAYQVAEAAGTTLSQNVRLFAYLNLALADNFITTSKGKGYYARQGFGWRPVTAIPLADQDGNPLTEADPDWQPLLTTPSHPEYGAGHPSANGTGSTVLKTFFGDNQSFSLMVGNPGPVRHFTSFSQAAAEGSDARIYGGVHFRFSNERSHEQGEAIANYVMSNFLQPLNGRKVGQVTHQHGSGDCASEGEAFGTESAY
jgi:hypothetical protein